jgi:hAT family C-terminal dimerisation region
MEGIRVRVPQLNYLARLARDVFAGMCSLVPSESAFSDSRQFIPPDRHSVSDKNLERSVVLRSWKCSRSHGLDVPFNPL